MMNIASVLLRCPGFFFSILPPFLCPVLLPMACIYDTSQRTSLRLLELLCLFTQRTRSASDSHLLKDRPQPTIFQYTNVKPRVLAQTWEKPEAYFMLQIPTCRICTFSELFCPLSNMVNSLPNFSWEHFLANDLSTNPHLKSSPGDPRLMATGAEFYVKHVVWN